MIIQGLKFLAATTLIVLAAFYINFIYLFTLEKMFLFVVNLSHNINWFFSFILPTGVTILTVIAYLPIIGIGMLLQLLSLKNNMKLLFSLYYCIMAFYNFKLIFFTPHINIVNVIGNGFFYYIGAIVTFCLIIKDYMCIISMQYDEEND